MTAQELLDQLCSKIKGDGEGSIYVETPAGLLRIDELISGVDTFEGVFFYLSGSDIMSTLSKYVINCQECGRTHQPAEQCWTKRAS